MIIKAQDGKNMTYIQFLQKGNVYIVKIMQIEEEKDF